MEEVKNTELTVATEENNADTTITAPKDTEQAPVEEAKFTQSQVDELIAKRLQRETKKFEKKLEEAKNPQPDLAAEELVEQLKKDLAARDGEILSYKLAKLASEANIRPERADAFIRLLDVKDIDTSDADALKDLIADAAKQYPEFTKAPAEPNPGYVKAGVEKSIVSEDEKIKDQIYAGLGLK